MIGRTNSKAKTGGATIPPWQNMRRSCGIAFVFCQSALRLGMGVFRMPNVKVSGRRRRSDGLTC